jgi:histidinol phosphatase-like PHP family hydrolase
MTREDIIRMAQEAGLHLATDAHWMPIIGLEYAEKFAALVAAAERDRAINIAMKAAENAYDKAVAREREACAELCEKFVLAKSCAVAIRKRGEK